VHLDRKRPRLGYTGIYSSFLRPAENAARRYGLDGRRPLLVLCRRGLVGAWTDVTVLGMLGMSGHPGIDLGPGLFEPGSQLIRRWNTSGRYHNGADEQLPVNG
jgi:hypothetical protein